MKTILLSLIFLLAFGPVFSQDLSNYANPDWILQQHGEIYFSFPVEDQKKLNEYSRVISVDHYQNGTVYAYANEKQWSAFLEMETVFVILQNPSTLISQPKMLNDINSKEIKSWDYYPTWSAYKAMMYQFETDYPQLCQIENIGYSTDGRELLVAKISDNVNTDEAEPEFLYTATMHGDETAGYVLMLRLIDYLLSNYASDPEIAMMVDNIEIWINPLANPDGTFAGGNNTVYGATRYNANGVDLNRNYPDPEDGPHPDGYAWQAETLAFMDFAEAHNFVMSANLHGGTEVVNYPWDTWFKRHPDNDWWILVSREFADTVHVYAPTGYMDGYDNGVTNGYDWYSIAGGRQDYMNYFHQCRECTIELSDEKLLDASELPVHWEYTYRSFLNYMQQCLYGLRGFITDAQTGNPLPAAVSAPGHDQDSSLVFASLPLGNYHRLLYGDEYLMKFHHPGYHPHYQHVSVSDWSTITLDVQLSSGTLIADFETAVRETPPGESLDFTDLSEGNVTSWYWTFDGGSPEHSSSPNPVNITYNNPGEFDVSLIILGPDGSDSLTIHDYIRVVESYNMGNNTVTTCGGTFYDSGGGDDNYSNYENYFMTFYPKTPGAMLKVAFEDFDIEYQSSCNYDYLRIYDGIDLSSPQIGEYCGTNSPGTITANNADGALTFFFHSDYSVTKPGWKATLSCEYDAVLLDLTVFLEGPFNGTGMNTGLYPSFVPTGQPYDQSPWNYSGTESLSGYPNTDVVDWVLVELRETAGDVQAATSATTIGRKAALLLQDGSVVESDGSGLLQFDLSISENLFVVIHHRNHLPVICAQPAVLNAGTYSWDFSDGELQAFGGNLAQKDLGNGFWGMIAGDGNASGQIDNSDKNLIWNPGAGNSGYLPGDFSLNGQVDNEDKNDLWTPNGGSGTMVP